MTLADELRALAEKCEQNKAKEIEQWWVNYSTGLQDAMRAAALRGEGRYILQNHHHFTRLSYDQQRKLIPLLVEKTGCEYKEVDDDDTYDALVW